MEKSNFIVAYFFVLGVVASGNTVTDQDLVKFSEKLFDMPRPVALKSVSVNFQRKTTSCGYDNANKNLYNVGDEKGILAIPTISKLIPLLDNFIADVKYAEDVSNQEGREEKEFMDAVLKTPEMKEAYNFLQSHAVYEGSMKDFSDYMHKIWFGLYDRSGTRMKVLDSSAFEHYFIGEIKRGKVSGQHNWLFQYLQEKAGKFNYRGFVFGAPVTFRSSKSAGAFGLTSSNDWNGFKKCTGSGLIGTTPELEMALATVCFMARREQACPLSFGSTKFSFTTHPFDYKGVTYIGTAYPNFS